MSVLEKFHSLQELKENPFELEFNRNTPKTINRFLNITATRALGLNPIASIYSQLKDCTALSEFSSKALKLFGVKYETNIDGLSNIPTSGPSVIIANHPYGGLDGLLLIHLLLQRRSDVRVLANKVLWRIPELREILIPVDILDPNKKQTNLRSLRTALEHVRNGGLLATFPAGVVSHLDIKNRQITDPQWSNTSVRLIRTCCAPITPIFFSGHNSTRFQLAGLIHPTLRTALLPRELTNKHQSPIQVSVGKQISSETISAFHDDTALGKFLRFRTYALNKQFNCCDKKQLNNQTKQLLRPIAKPSLAQQTFKELSTLPQNQHLLESNGLEIVYAKANQIPSALLELGRLRELTFRAVGEGTGKERDIDLYDNYYTHIICWNPPTREIVGSYRIGAVDQILSHYGLSGLYTNTLFNFDKELFQQTEMAHGNALELGRSFVRQEYQRNYTPLLSLWRGICTYVAKHPQYRILFGPVSISNDYLPTSRMMLVDFLKHHYFDNNLSRYIRPKNQLRRHHPLASLSKDLAKVSTLDSLSNLLAQIEPDSKGVPVLVRQYIKFGGKMLGFNLDANFGDVIDGLITVDLPRTELKTLQRYMGKDEAIEYIRHHPL